MFRTIDYDTQSVGEADVPGIDATTSDVNMQFDLFGSLLSLTAWAGKARNQTNRSSHSRTP